MDFVPQVAARMAEDQFRCSGCGSGSGLVADSGRVAVAGDCWLWQCGHFDRWQVEIRW
jgi:hypothetical protein